MRSKRNDNEAIMLRVYSKGRDDARLIRGNNLAIFADNELFRKEYQRGYEKGEKEKNNKSYWKVKGEKKATSAILVAISEIDKKNASGLEKKPLKRKLDFILNKQKKQINDTNFTITNYNQFLKGILDKCQGYLPRQKELYSNHKIQKILEEAKAFHAEPVDAFQIFKFESVDVSDIKYASSSSAVLGHLNAESINPTNKEDEAVEPPQKRRRIGSYSSSSSTFKPYSRSVSMEDQEKDDDVMDYKI